MVDEVLFSSNKHDWVTPDDLFDNLNDYFNFTLDAAANKRSTKCKLYYTDEVEYMGHHSYSRNGLKHSWEGEQVFVNPPYSHIALWVKKAYEESLKDTNSKVMLIPARTDTRYFNDYCSRAARLYFIKGRLKFSNSKNTAPFPSVIVVFNRTASKREVYWTDRKFKRFW